MNQNNNKKSGKKIGKNVYMTSIPMTTFCWCSRSLAKRAGVQAVQFQASRLARFAGVEADPRPGEATHTGRRQQQRLQLDQTQSLVFGFHVALLAERDQVFVVNKEGGEGESHHFCSSSCFLFTLLAVSSFHIFLWTSLFYPARSLSS